MHGLSRKPTDTTERGLGCPAFRSHRTLRPLSPNAPRYHQTPSRYRRTPPAAPSRWPRYLSVHCIHIFKHMVMNLLRKVRIRTGLPLRRTANCRIARVFMLPAIGPDAKFLRQCEFDHTDWPRCSLSEECLGKRAIYPAIGLCPPVVVIYLTSISVSALIDVRHGRYPTAPRPCDGNLELARRPDPRHVHAQTPAADPVAVAPGVKQIA